MSDEYNDEVVERAWERVQNDIQKERLEQLMQLNDLEGIYYDSYADND